MIRHHPEDSLLLAYAAGQLPAGPAIVIASHIENCAHCCQRMQEFEAVGGALLETIDPVLLEPQALARAMAAIDAGDAEPRKRRPATALGAGWPALPPGARWPQALRGCTIAPWRWVGPGMHWSRVTMPHDPDGNLFLLRMGPGKKLP
ncbi:MAG: transcriptional regulator, partial [Comamonadaceae bacterium]